MRYIRKQHSHNDHISDVASQTSGPPRIATEAAAGAGWAATGAAADAAASDGRAAAAGAEMAEAEASIEHTFSNTGFNLVRTLNGVDMHSFIDSFIYSFIDSLPDSLVHSLIHCCGPHTALSFSSMSMLSAPARWPSTSCHRSCSIVLQRQEE